MIPREARRPAGARSIEVPASRVGALRIHWQRLRREESGAAAVMVAILSILLIAVLALVIDYGLLQTKNGELQVAADAAALAIADDCARGVTAGCASSGAGLALAHANDADTASAVVSSTERTVTVTATAEVPFSLIGAFGLADTTLQRQATAAWTRPTEAGAVTAARVPRFAVAECRLPSSLPAPVELRSGWDCQSGLLTPDFRFLGSSCDSIVLRVGDEIPAGASPGLRSCDLPRGDATVIVPLWERVCAIRVIICLSWEDQVVSFGLFDPSIERYSGFTGSFPGRFLPMVAAHPDIVAGGGAAVPGEARLID